MQKINIFLAMCAILLVSFVCGATPAINLTEVTTDSYFSGTDKFYYKGASPELTVNFAYSTNGTGFCLVSTSDLSDFTGCTRETDETNTTTDTHCYFDNNVQSTSSVITISGLPSGERYYYTCQACDNDDNCDTTSDYLRTSGTFRILTKSSIQYVLGNLLLLVAVAVTLIAVFKSNIEMKKKIEASVFVVIAMFFMWILLNL